ncbi:hypothetical protein D9M69_590780 [compost metagenome]
MIANAGKRANNICPPSATDVNFITFKSCIKEHRAGHYITHDLFRLHYSLNVEQPKSFNLVNLPFDAVRITDAASEHLKPAANAKHMPAAPHMGL